MRNLLCESCGTKKGKTTGVRMIFAGSMDGEPAEYERVIWGRAREPKASQRMIRIGDTIKLLDPAYYNCDLCNAPIRPSDPCATWTVWVEGRSFREGDEPEVWEDDLFSST